jgi:hypothetical protein
MTRISDTNRRPLGYARSLAPSPDRVLTRTAPRISTPWGRFCGVARSRDRGSQQYRILGSGTGGRRLALAVRDRRIDQIRRACCVVSPGSLPQNPSANRSRFTDAVSLAAGTRDTDLNSVFGRRSTRPASASSCRDGPHRLAEGTHRQTVHQS